MDIHEKFKELTIVEKIAWSIIILEVSLGTIGIILCTTVAIFFASKELWTIALQILGTVLFSSIIPIVVLVAMDAIKDSLKETRRW